MAGLTEWDRLPELLSLRFPGVWVSTLRVLLPLFIRSGHGALCPSGISWVNWDWNNTTSNINKSNAKCGVSPRLKIWPADLDLWPWKSIGFQILLRTKYVPCLKIHWRMLILECSQGCCMVKIWPSDIDLWPWKSIRFQTLLRTKYVPSLVKIHWRMLILECSQGCYGRMVALLYPFATSLARG